MAYSGENQRKQTFTSFDTPRAVHSLVRYLLKTLGQEAPYRHLKLQIKAIWQIYCQETGLVHIYRPDYTLTLFRLWVNGDTGCTKQQLEYYCDHILFSSESTASRMFSFLTKVTGTGWTAIGKMISLLLYFVQEAASINNSFDLTKRAHRMLLFSQLTIDAIINEYKEFISNSGGWTQLVKLVNKRYSIPEINKIVRFSQNMTSMIIKSHIHWRVCLAMPRGEHPKFITEYGKLSSTLNEDTNLALGCLRVLDGDVRSRKAYKNAVKEQHEYYVKCVKDGEPRSFFKVLTHMFIDSGAYTWKRIVAIIVSTADSIIDAMIYDETDLAEQHAEDCIAVFEYYKLNEWIVSQGGWKSICYNQNFGAWDHLKAKDYVRDKVESKMDTVFSHIDHSYSNSLVWPLENRRYPNTTPRPKIRKFQTQPLASSCFPFESQPPTSSGIASNKQKKSQSLIKKSLLKNVEKRSTERLQPFGLKRSETAHVEDDAEIISGENFPDTTTRKSEITPVETFPSSESGRSDPFASKSKKNTKRSSAKKRILPVAASIDRPYDLQESMELDSSDQSRSQERKASMSESTEETVPRYDVTQTDQTTSMFEKEKPRNYKEKTKDIHPPDETSMLDLPIATFKTGKRRSRKGKAKASKTTPVLYRTMETDLSTSASERDKRNCQNRKTPTSSTIDEMLSPMEIQEPSSQTSLPQSGQDKRKEQKETSTMASSKTSSEESLSIKNTKQLRKKSQLLIVTKDIVAAIIQKTLLTYAKKVEKSAAEIKCSLATNLPTNKTRTIFKIVSNIHAASALIDMEEEYVMKLFLCTSPTFFTADAREHCMTLLKKRHTQGVIKSWDRVLMVVCNINQVVKQLIENHGPKSFNRILELCNWCEKFIDQYCGSFIKSLVGGWDDLFENENNLSRRRRQFDIPAVSEKTLSLMTAEEEELRELEQFFQTITAQCGPLHPSIKPEITNKPDTGMMEQEEQTSILKPTNDAPESFSEHAGSLSLSDSLLIERLSRRAIFLRWQTINPASPALKEELMQQLQIERTDCELESKFIAESDQCLMMCLALTQVHKYTADFLNFFYKTLSSSYDLAVNSYHDIMSQWILNEEDFQLIHVVTVVAATTLLGLIIWRKRIEEKEKEVIQRMLEMVNFCQNFIVDNLGTYITSVGGMEQLIRTGPENMFIAMPMLESLHSFNISADQPTNFPDLGDLNQCTFDGINTDDFDGNLENIDITEQLSDGSHQSVETQEVAEVVALDDDEDE